MANLNKVYIIGNLVADPEIHTFPSGKNCVKLRVATTRRFQDTNGNWQDATTYIDAKGFGHAVNHTQKWLRKGSTIHIEGRLDQETWQDKQTGANRSKITLHIENLQGLSNLKEQSPIANSQSSIVNRQSSMQNSQSSIVNSQFTDDIPF